MISFFEGYLMVEKVWPNYPAIFAVPFLLTLIYYGVFFGYCIYQEEKN